MMKYITLHCIAVLMLFLDLLPLLIIDRTFSPFPLLQFPSKAQVLFNDAECQVDSLANLLFGFGNLVEPMVLHSSAHHKQAPVFKAELQLLRLVLPVLHVECTDGSETHGSNHRILPQLLLVVCMPSIAVLPVSVQV